MNEFEMNVYSQQRQQQLQNESEQNQRARIARTQSSPTVVRSVNDSNGIPLLARLGTVLVDLGEHLQARYGDALDTMTVHTVDPQPDSGC